MKYRIKAVRIIAESNTPIRLRARRRTTTALCPYRALTEQKYAYESILLGQLFAVGALPEAKKPSAFRRFIIGATSLTKKLRKKFKRVLSCLFSYPSRVPTSPHLLLGAVCGVMCVAVVSAITVLVGLFGKYFAPYDEIVIPSFVGQSYEQTEAMSDNRIELLVSFENDETVAAGIIMSQTPSAGVTRKLLGKNKFCTVEITVSMGKAFFNIPDLSGMPRRDALLLLRNAGVAVNIVTEHSDTMTGGSVISTLPPSGQRLYEGEQLTLRISLGKAIPMVKVPDLYGLNEVQAIALLKYHGLRVGEISYSTADAEAGKVISQQYTAYSMLPEGGTVNITVSLGNGHTQRYVPDLYGCTVDEARARLAEVGLVIGSTYTVSSAAPTGTVVAQGYIAGTPITSTIISIDIYVSS